MTRSSRPVRDWLDSHPVTAVYVTLAITVVLILRIIDTISELT